jgi:signal transduction histidine kinase
MISLLTEKIIWLAGSLLTTMSAIFTIHVIWSARSNIDRGLRYRFLFYLSSLATWSSCVFLFSICDDERTVYALSLMLHIAAACIPVAYMSFTTAFHRKRTRFDKVELTLVYASAIFFLGHMISGNGMILAGVEPKRSFTFFPSSGPMYPYWVASFFYIVISTQIKSWRMLSQIDPKLRTAYRIFTIVNTIAFASCCAYFLPVFGYYVLPYPYGAFGSALLTTTFLASVLYEDYFGLGVVVKKALILSIAISCYIAIYVLILVLMYNYLDTYFGQNLILATSFLLLVLIVIGEPARIHVQKWLETLFFSGSIGVVSEQKEYLESELERSHRLKSVGILAAGMAHEIRNPIQSLMTFGEHLEKKHDDPEFRAKFESMLKRETDRIKDLTSDLLEFSKPKEPNRQKTDLLSIINEMIELVSTELTQQGITYKANTPKELVHATVDADQIKQALLNLILNAKDAMQDSAVKELTITLEDKTIYIQDTGCGIAPDRIPHLFDPFYTSKEKGTGLGLAITHSLIEKNHGAIQLNSELNKGTLFTIHLP